MDENGNPQPICNKELHPVAPEPGKGYPPEDRRKIRVEWETGTATFKKLGEKYGINAGTIKSWSFRERWNRKPIIAAINELIQEQVKENIIERLNRLGLPEDDFIKMIIEGAKETKMLRNIKKPMIDPETGQVMMSKKGRPIVADQTISVIDNDNTRKYRELLVQLIGLKAAPKGAISAERETLQKPIPVAPYMQKVPFPKELNESANN